MVSPELHEKTLESALMQFIFPFSVNPGSQKDFIHQLEEDGYRSFSLKNLDQQHEFYGEEYQVSHRNMERYFLPFTANVIFPHEPDDSTFRRLSRRLDYHCLLKTSYMNIRFTILSADVILCPFDLGFITVRTQVKSDLQETLTFTEALEFANRFRALQDITPQDDTTFIVHDDREYAEVEDFLFKCVVSGLLPYLDKREMQGAYFETMPYFVDERMYVQAFYAFPEGEEISQEDRYRAGRIDGVNHEGKPFISSSNKSYIAGYLQGHEYERWAPNTHYVIDDSSFCCITNIEKRKATELANQMYGEFYYGLLLNLFHKIVLLKLSNQYSRISLVKNQEQIEELISEITTFSSKYFFLELVTQSQGREIFIQLRRLFGHVNLYEEVKRTLNDLYKYQDDSSSRRSNYLLVILTVFAVISGIYGMNQVIDDLKYPINWSAMREYSFFQYLALGVTFSGIFVGLSLGVSTLYRWGKELLKNRRRKR